jgi:glycosyltransferase involved in cell wall biosynthesis
VGWWRKAFGYFQDWIEGKAYKHSQRIVAVTPRIKEVLVAEYGIEKDKIAVVENGANTDLFTPTDTDEARRRANLSGADHFVTFVGNLLQWQGVEYLIRSVPYVLEEFPTTRFLIVGGGTTKPALVDLARGIGVSDSVIFTEVVPYENVPMYLNASEICVAPFIRGRNERSGVSPLKIHEYGACGKAVVASRLPGLEFVEQCQTGLLVQPESAEELARAIVKLLRDPELRKRMGENGRKYVVENRSWESVAISVAAVSREAMEDHKAKKNRRKP